MIKQLYLLFAIQLAIHVNSVQIKNVNPKDTNISPYDLLDEAQTELEDLRETVESSIEENHTELDRLANDVRNYQYIMLRAASNIILNAYRDIDAQVTTIKDLANSENKDISSCLEDREDRLSTIRYEYLDDLGVCVPTTLKFIDDTLDSFKYYVDVEVTKVNDLEFQLGRCTADSITCILPIVAQIELQIVQLPQDIQAQVIEAADQFEHLKVVIMDCRNPIVDNATSAGNAILAEISDCVNEIVLFL